MDSESQKRLNNLLHGWRPKAELPPRFESEVWRRIAAAQDRRASRCNFAWLFQFAAQPRLAFAVVALAVVIGGGLATWQAQWNYRHQLAEAKARYIRSVDPLAQASLASNL